MASIYKRNDVVDFEFTFMDDTGQLIDVFNAAYTVTYFNGSTEVLVVPLTSLTHLDTGLYAMQWLIPSTALINQKYYVHARGENPDTHYDMTSEREFQVLSDGYFAGGLVVKFTKE